MLWPFVSLVLRVLSMLELMVVLAVLTHWFDADPNNFFVRVVRAPVDPLLKLVRPLARRIPGPLDWSPAIVLLGIEAISRLLVSIFR